MGRIRRWWASALVAVLCLFGLAACGGGGGGDTPATPTAIYGGAATAGDIFVIKMDYPSTGRATVTQSSTEGTVVDSREVTYTSSGNTYTFTDAEANQYTAFVIPDAMFVMQSPDKSDILIAVKVDTTLVSASQLDFLKSRDYILTQFRHDRKGVKWVWSNVAADGTISGHHANADMSLPIDLDDTATNNDFTAGMNLNSFIYNSATSGFNLAVDEDGELDTWTLYYTPSGLAVIDKGPLKGLRFNTPKGTSTNPADYGITAGAVYDAVFYGSQSETNNGTSVGTITVTAVGADNFTVTVDPGRGDPAQIVKGVATASDLWRGFFSLQDEAGNPQNAAVQPVTAGAVVFAGKQGEWNYNYGVGIKR